MRLYPPLVSCIPPRRRRRGGINTYFIDYSRIKQHHTISWYIMKFGYWLVCARHLQRQELIRVLRHCILITSQFGELIATMSQDNDDASSALQQHEPPLDHFRCRPIITHYTTTHCSIQSLFIINYFII